MIKPGLTSDRLHTPKNWSIYFLEFLLIFLAVTLGFFAESIRERMGDEDKEQEFIISMMEDAVTDSIRIQGAIARNKKRMLSLDTLGVILCSGKRSPEDGKEIHRLFRRAISHPDFVSPTERTMTQLKNAGGMRLIRKKRAVAAIVEYDDMAKNLIDQQAFYELYQNKSIDLAVQILNFQNFKDPSLLPPGTQLSTQLLTDDPMKLKGFGNQVSVYQGVVRFYIYRLEEMKQHARNLIGTLKEEYKMVP